MKKHILSLALVAAMTVFVTSCQKETVEDNTNDTALAQGSSNATDVVEGVNDEAEYRMSPSTAITGCPTITWASPRGTFPNTITIDYGTGCVARNGRTLAGQVIVNESAGYFTEGSVRAITTSNFTVDGNTVEFTRTVTNQGTNESSQMYWTVVVTGTRIKADDKTATWSANRVRTMTEGQTTLEDIEDDAYSITGTDEGTCATGATFTSTITTPLVKRMSCHWVESGVVSITTTGRRSGTRTLDFGNGTCDNKGTLTTRNGDSREITLRR